MSSVVSFRDTIDLSGSAAAVNAALVPKGYSSDRSDDEFSIGYRLDARFWITVVGMIVFIAAAVGTAFLIMRATGAPFAWFIAFAAIAVVTLSVTVPLVLVFRCSLARGSPIVTFHRSGSKISCSDGSVVLPLDRIVIVKGKTSDEGLDRVHHHLTILALVKDVDDGAEPRVRLILATLNQDIRSHTLAEELGNWVGQPIPVVHLAMARMPCTGEITVLQGLF